MKINPDKVIPLECLIASPENPKKRLGVKYRKGLDASYETFGFSGVLCVADNLDGTYQILDANTRSEDLRAAGIKKHRCVVVESCAGSPTDPGVIAMRRQFMLSYDRNRKLFDEDAVNEQLKELATETDLALLATLAAVDRKSIDQMVQDSKQSAGSRPTPPPPAAESKSLLIFGPAADIDAIKDMVARFRGGKALADKVKNILSQAMQSKIQEDETFLGIMLASMVQFEQRVFGDV